MTPPAIDDLELCFEDAEPAAPQLTRRCDFCGGLLGLIIHRYYRMRFCCEAHMMAYCRRLTEETRTKIRHLSSRRADCAVGQ